MRPIAVRFDDATLRLLDDFAALERERTPGRRCSRSDAIRLLVERGLHPDYRAGDALVERVSAKIAERSERENETPPEWARRGARDADRFRVPSEDELGDATVEVHRRMTGAQRVIEHAAWEARAHAAHEYNVLCRLCRDERERPAAKQGE